MYKAFGCFGTTVVIILVGVFALVVLTSVEDSRAVRARAEAAAEDARAYARVQEARAQVDEIAAREDGKLARQVEQHEYELATIREETRRFQELQAQENQHFQERLVLLATVLEGMGDEDLDRLMAQMGAEEARGHTPWWWSVVAAILAVITFIMLTLGALGWRAWRVWRRGWVE